MRASPAMLVPLLLPAAALPALAQAPDGAAVFAGRCAQCHTAELDSRAPGPDALGQRSPEAIIDSLMNGVMRLQGSRLSGAERRAVAEYLTGREIGGDISGPDSARCASSTRLIDPLGVPHWNGWGGAGNRRFQTAEQAGLTAAEVPDLRLKWAFGFPDTSVAWAQATVAGGRVYIGSQSGIVYSLDAGTGCVHWTFGAGGGVRTAVSLGPNPAAAGGYAVYFADTQSNAYAVDAATGAHLWTVKVEEHPRSRITGSPVLFEERVYVPVSSYEEVESDNPEYACCTFRGSVSALDVATGRVEWKTYTIADEPRPRGESTAGVTLYGPSGNAIWSAPTIDPERRLVYAATGNGYSDPPQPTGNAVLAMDLDSGAIRWVRQVLPGDVYIAGCPPDSTNPNCPEDVGPDLDFGNSPILTRGPDGRDIIVIGQKSGIGWALDPDREGEVLWQYRAGVGGLLGGMEWGSATDGERAYFPVSDLFTPAPGGLHAVSLATGARAWHAPPPAPICAAGPGCNGAQPGAVAVIPGAVFSGSYDGGIRAYSTTDGSVIWTYDTNRDFETANGVGARGGSISAGGPTVAGGLLLVPSGYGGFGGRAGNVLLAFGID
ncbi:MAG: PQQ-binding-like beta-propeller repeat protein [Acidobacteria bacterium]|nr:PQQ-binding-like beta-propeller repeat protein [Acidobacteriota bacterium]